jgi:hypothetical protein
MNENCNIDENAMPNIIQKKCETLPKEGGL